MPHMIRATLWLSFFGLILVSWVYMYLMATGMGLDLIGRPDAMAQAWAFLDLCLSGDLQMVTFGPIFVMWAVMMSAMMLPTMVPTLATYDRLILSADGSRAGWVGVVLGYLVVWIAFAAVAAGLQLLLVSAGVVNRLGVAVEWFSVMLLIVAGAYQFTRTKETCHGACLSPMSYFLGHWKTGFDGGLRMGLGLGVFCVGCCWAYMAIGFVGGVMNLLWMGLATLLMVFEKLPDIGRYVVKPVGVALIAAGLGMAFL
ncbi:MAG: DUF2182 domain-containing protein [Yoonia sp.]|uniref:DUF2182 domain-containing protein n=1 Tax=Yoonia sp. TaxID=2212373 RepID=UPI003EF7EE40